VRVPLSWLTQFVDVSMGLDEFVEFIGRSGLEVDAVLSPGAGTRGVVTARVLDRRPHPDADKLQVVHVTHGDDEVELVCGAWNFEVDDVVLHAQVGGAIPGLELQARSIRGVTSNGMLCSARELELGDDHGGIMLLDPSTPPGVDVHELLPLGEPVIDIEVMADRGDHLSILGVAREVSALTGAGPVRMPDVASSVPGRDVPVTIEATDGCRQFVAWTLEDLDLPSASPWWLRQRLAQCGVRAISPLVDVTNLVMLELGQPMHAYDLVTLAGPELRVRWGHDGEVLTTLDDVERRLDPQDLVVADAERAVGLGGVMGGAATEVAEATRSVVLEAATWDPATIRRTSRRLRLTSEASTRFERGVDPAGAERACARAVQLIQDMGRATDRGVTRDGTAEVERPTVTVSATGVRDFLGLGEELDGDRQASLLRALGCAVEARGDDLAVTPPSWRSDVTRPADVAEEVARLNGYDRIPATLPLTGVTGGLTTAQHAERSVRDAALAFGLHEVVTRPFVGEEHLDGVHPGGAPVVLANPLAKDASAMRTSLVEGLLEVVRHNVGQGVPGVAVFEMGRLFRAAGGPLDALLDELSPAWRWETPDGRVLPTQPRTLALALQGRRSGPGFLDRDTTWGVHDALAVLDEVVRRLAPTRGAWTLRRVPADRDALHPHRTATLELVGLGDDPATGHEIGVVGQLHPREAERRDLPEPVVVAELLLEPMLLDVAAGRVPASAPRLVRHPAMTVDVAVQADDDIPWERLETAIRTAAGDLLDTLAVFDEYRGDQVGEGRRSVAARLRLQAADRALTSDDEEAVLAAVRREVEAVGAQVRG
jgi:phenylalanyl-tRNA synthetase beta chain